MSNVFSKVQAAEGDNIDEDFVGGGRLLETDLYSGTVKAAYMTESASSKAMALNVIIDVKVNGKSHEVKQQLWTHNGKGEVTYKHKTTGVMMNLPGYSQAESLSLLTVGKKLADLDVEEKTLKLYDFKAKKDIDTAVDCFVEIHGQPIMIAVQKQTVNKQKKNDQTGKYEDIAETRDQNEVIKFFSAEPNVTISEVSEYIKSLGENFNEVIEAGNLLKAISTMKDEMAVYGTTWVEKNRGETYDKSKKVGSGAGKAFAGGAGKDKAADAPAPGKSLFD